MSAIKVWIQEFLQAEGRKLTAPDGRPLYAYKIRNAEFIRLGKTLTSCLASRGSEYAFTPLNERLFVLYAAEWWRRRYSGGSWKWEDVFKSIGWPALAASERQQLTAKGLKYWGRDIYVRESGSSAYLLSLVTEGGFPVRLIERTQTHLSRYLKAILRDYAKYRNTTLDIERIAESHDHRLPSAFRKPAVFRLAADTIRAVFELSSLIGDSADPFAALESASPDWKARLPLSLESAGARSLVNGLLSNAKDSQNKINSRISLQRRFILSDDNSWIHEATLELPQALTLMFVAEQLGLPESAIPRRMDLAAYTEGSFNKVATITRESEECLVYPHSARGLRFTIKPGSDLTCVVLDSSSGRLGELPVIGGYGVNEELPVVCYRDDDSIVVLGQGSMKTRLDRVLVCIPPEFKNTLVVGLAVLDMSVADLHEGCSWVELDESTRFQSETGLECIVTLGAASDSSAGCVLRGQRALIHEYGPRPCFIGVPNVFEVFEDQIVRVDSTSVQWRPTKKSHEWKTVSGSPPCGTVRMRAFNGDSCIFSTTCTVLPESFATKIVGGASSMEGELRIKGGGDCDLILDPHPEINGSVQQIGEDQILKLASQRPYAGKFTLNMLWREGFECKILVPFPGGGANFVGVDGSAIEDEYLPVSALATTSAIAVTHGKNRQCIVHGALLARDIPEKITRSTLDFHKVMAEVSDGYYELKLIEVYNFVKDLFSYSADLDALVKLSVIINSQVTAAIRVSQFDSQLSFDQSRKIISLLDAAQRPIISDVNIGLVSLGGDDLPELQAIDVLSGGGVEWSVSDEDCEQYACLATVRGPTAKNIRPCVVPGGNNQQEACGSSLSDVCLIADTSERIRAIGSFFDSLAGDPSSDSWGDLLHAVERFSDVHPDSVDIYSSIIDKPKILAGLFVRSSAKHFSSLLDLQHYLPFRWWQVPVDDFRLAVQEYCTFIEYKYKDFAEDILEGVVARFGQLAKETDLFQPVRAEALFGSSESLTETDLKRLFKVELDTNLRNTLISAHGDSTWPNGITRHDWRRLLGQDLPWLGDGGVRHRQTYLDAVIAQAYSVASGIYLPREYRAIVDAVRRFDEDSFAKMFNVAVPLFSAYRRLASG